MGAEVILKGSTVDGVYDADPRLFSDAERYVEITYEEALQKRLSVMDPEAFSLCQTHQIPLIIFDYRKPRAIVDIVEGKKIGTLVH
jgi:uridylate kinase